MSANAHADERYVILIGTMKGATTSAWRIMANHPQVWPCRKKEPNFFGDEELWSAGIESYRAMWEEEARPPGPHIRFEATTHYSKYPNVGDVPERMQASGLDIQCLYILRDPIDRIESHMAHLVSRGRTTVEDIRSRGTKALRYPIRLSCYAAQLDRYRACGLGVELIDFSEFVSDQANTVAGIQSSLGLDVWLPDAPVRANVRRNDNEAGQIRITDEYREAIVEAVQSDVARLRDEYGFTPRWAATYA
jgi:hypothetical protein